EQIFRNVQIALVQSYAARLEPRGQAVAQLLLSADDVGDRRRHTNARNTVSTLLSLGVLPIVNENDTVAIEEIKFGDNDQLSAHVAQLVDAQLLVLLTDVDGFYDADPHHDPSATRYDFIDVVTSLHLGQAGPTTSGVGLGGMVTKLRAARQAALSGTSTVIAAGRGASVLERIAEGEDVGTWIAADRRLGARKHWIVYSSEPTGTLEVDAGARAALTERGTSLLPSGVTAVHGNFARGDSVRVVDDGGVEIGRGLATYAADDLRRIAGRQSSAIREVLGYKYFDEVIRRDDFVLTSGLEPTPQD
ncbi:MAG: glutamate 5-kinase, partial [Thermoanaerobaculia bacterium]|nr:glutamate 5-kinase [Thermoanaerobaculia bacterium]